MEGRAAFARQAWQQAHAQLAAADRESRLEPEDCERMAIAAHLVGRDDYSEAMWTRAHTAMADRGDVARAARCAFWLGFVLLSRGEGARGSGWLARAHRLVADEPSCAEHGYVLLPTALARLDADAAAAAELFDEATQLGERHDDADLAALGRLGHGQASIRAGDAEAGVTWLDDAMLSVTAGEVSPLVAGIVYCGVIEACQEAFDLRRAQQWTIQLDRWCAAQPDLVAYRGQCLVHRAELLQLHGDWPAAMDEAERARARLSQPPGQPAIGMAFYQQGELRRLRGELAEAEAAYQQASEAGRDPQPGLALLRLAQGRAEAATTMIHRALDETGDPARRARHLAALVDIALAVGDVDAALAGADELAAIAADRHQPWLAAIAADADGATRLAQGQPASALTALRAALAAWRELLAPYEAARTRVRIAQACRELDDLDTAALELDQARRVFESLGAVPDLAGVDELSGAGPPQAAGGLTARELEVLSLVAGGHTNREVAAELVLSEHTVRRHLQNIFTKLGVSSRAAATAYVLRHDLL